MLSYIVVILVAVAVAVCMITSNGAVLLDATMGGAQDALSVCINLLGIVALWNGLFRVAQKAGIIDTVTKWMRPVTKFLFKHVDDPVTRGHITTNMVSNFIGLGNAATPSGVAAMRRLGDRAGGASTRDISRFCVLNTASIQLIPTTIIGLRAAAGSAAAAEILPCVWITSFASAAVGLLVVTALTRKA